MIIKAESRNRNIVKTIYYKTGLIIYPNGQLRIKTVFAGRA
jgi:hypothetical protein